MKFNRDIHHRRSIRLQRYDYAQPGIYFVTLCAQQRKCIFGQIVDGAIDLSPIGQCAISAWQNLPDRFTNAQLDAHVVMPNHIHLLIQLTPVDAHHPGAPTLGTVIGAYKSLVFHKALAMAKQNGEQLGELWQRNYWEHVVRNEEELIKIREYIQNNPRQWEFDKLYVK